MDLGTEMSERPPAHRSAFTPERTLELKRKARELFSQGLDYSSTRSDSFGGRTHAKPVWE